MINKYNYNGMNFEIENTMHDVKIKCLHPKGNIYHKNDVLLGIANYYAPPYIYYNTKKEAIKSLTKRLKEQKEEMEKIKLLVLALRRKYISIN